MDSGFEHDATATWSAIKKYIQEQLEEYRKEESEGAAF